MSNLTFIKFYYSKFISIFVISKKRKKKNKNVLNALNKSVVRVLSGINVEVSSPEGKNCFSIGTVVF